MTVRAKFQVLSIEQQGWEPGIVGQITVKAKPIYCGRKHLTQEEENNCESHSYAKATPDGDLRLVITNPNAYNQFQIGGYVYLDMTPAMVPA